GDRAVTRVVVGGTPRGRADRSDLDRVHEVRGPARATVRGPIDVDLVVARERVRVAVLETRLGQHDGPVRQDVAVERVDVPVAVDDLRLRPRRAGVVGLRDPRVATGRTVERDVHVVPVVRHGEDRLVV